MAFEVASPTVTVQGGSQERMVSQPMGSPGTTLPALPLLVLADVLRSRAHRDAEQGSLMQSAAVGFG